MAHCTERGVWTCAVARGLFAAGLLLAVAGAAALTAHLA